MRRKVSVLLIVLLVVVVAAVGAYLFVRATLASDLVRSTLEQQLGARLGQPVQIRSAGASLFPRITLDLADVSIGTPAAIHLGTVRIVVGLRGLFSRTITDAEVIVTGGRMTMPLPFPLVRASGSPTQAPAAGSTLTVASVRLIALRDFVVTGGNQTLRVDLESSLDGDRLDVRQLIARAERTEVRAEGSVSSLANLEANFEAAADPLDLDEVIAIASALTTTSASPHSGDARVPVHISVKLTARAGRFESLDLLDLSSTIDIRPARLALAPLAVRAFDGNFKGRLAVDSRGRTPQLRLGGQIERLDVAELLKASGSPGGLTGRLGGTVSLNGEGSDTQALRRTSRGTITAAITDGSIPHLDMVRTIVLAFGKPSGAPPAGSGSAFSRLGGTFALAGGTLTSNDMTMTSRDFDMAGNGSLRIETGAVDARSLVVLSEELTAQAGTDLRRYAQQDGRVTVPVTVGGTLEQPVVSVDIAAAAQRAIGNELKRRATSLLEGLFKKKRE